MVPPAVDDLVGRPQACPQIGAVARRERRDGADVAAREALLARPGPLCPDLISPSTTPARSSALRSQVKQRAQAWQSAATARAAVVGELRQHVGERLAEVVAGPTSQPVRPSTTESLIPGAAIATHGTPQAAASITEQPQPSATEVRW